jgi:glutamine amidotransferase/cyclase
MPTVHLLDYVAGNVRSLANAIEKIGYQIEWIKEPNDIQYAEVRSNALDSELSHCYLS